MMGEMCTNSTEFEYAVQPDAGPRVRRLYRCRKCGRVARTVRPHQLANKNTASHDKTMGILWDHARLMGDVNTARA